MTIGEFIEAFDRIAPLSLALEGDPIGLQIGDAEAGVRAVAVAYEVTEEVVARAAIEGADLIVCFHPLIYTPLRSIGRGSRVERVVTEMLRRGMALYVLHTALDAHPRGSNALLGAALGLSELRPLLPSPTMEGAGFGAAGRLDVPMTLAEFASVVRTACNAHGVRVSVADGSDLTRSISNVAVVAGSGMSFYDLAVASGADAFVTADIRYHDFHRATDSIPVIDPGHAESERFVEEGMALLVEEACLRLPASLRVIRTGVSTNPVHSIVS